LSKFLIPFISFLKKGHHAGMAALAGDSQRRFARAILERRVGA
jgi:hypothetical protein